MIIYELYWKDNARDMITSAQRHEYNNCLEHNNCLVCIQNIGLPETGNLDDNFNTIICWWSPSTTTTYIMIYVVRSNFQLYIGISSATKDLTRYTETKNTATIYNNNNNITCIYSDIFFLTANISWLSHFFIWMKRRFIIFKIDWQKINVFILFKNKL